MSAYWFRPKRFGYGVTPCTWQGWAFSTAICLAAFACAELARRNAPANLLDFHGAAEFWFAVLSGAIILIGGIYISHIKTEGGLWRRSST